MATDSDATPATSDDAALMARVQRSDEAAFSTLMERWELPVKAVIGRLVLNTSEAEDLAQETFVRLWKHRDRYQAGRPVKPWILGIALNLARNRLRWWRLRPTINLDDWSYQSSDEAVTHRHAAGELEGVERGKAVRNAIAQLPSDQREVLILATYEELSHAEIAVAVGATPKAVENRLARARQRLRDLLVPYSGH